MRRLQAPTLTQWACAHQWKTTTSRPGEGDVVRLRYLTCRRCGLKVKTEERLAVPWDEGTLMAVVAQVFPEGVVAEVATLWEHGLLDGGLSQLNAHLAPTAGSWTWYGTRGGWWASCDGESHTNKKRHQGR